MEGDRPVGYVLNFPKGKVNYCATLAVHPDYQKTRVNYLLIRAMVKKLILEGTEECRFLVEPDNHDARSVHEALGARVVKEVDDFYWKGDKRLWSVIDKQDMERIRVRYTRLKLVS
jgi:ribosomal protein S18 acetylase RimI-like enzyme